MSGMTAKSTRRAFFLGSGAALGAGLASTVVVAAPKGAARDGDHEGIRRLHLAFTTLIQSQRYEEAVELFDDQAHLDLSGVRADGKPDIQRLFAEQYRQQKAPAIHGGYRQSPLQLNDSLSFAADHQHATATFHVEVELCTPLQDDCTAAQMARLQGQMADRRWESGRFEASYVRRRADWKVASLRYLAAA